MRMVASTGARQMFATNVMALSHSALMSYFRDSTIDLEILAMARAEYHRRIALRPNVCEMHMDDRALTTCPCYAAAFKADAETSYRWDR